VFKAHSQFDFIFTDFSKTFNHIDHQILLCIFQATGFGDPLLLWSCSFTDGRKQFVKIHGVSSAILPTFSVVPQGGHLFPLLFFVFLNGIHRTLEHAQLLAFADDVKIFDRIGSQNDGFVLQDELN